MGLELGVLPVRHGIITARFNFRQPFSHLNCNRGLDANRHSADNSNHLCRPN